MLSRIHILLAAVAIILHTEASSQVLANRSIKWAPATKTYTSSTGAKIQMVTFDGAGTSRSDGFLPHYGENIRIPQYGAITPTLSNEVYETITATDIKADKIGQTIQVTATCGIIRKMPYAVVSFIPLRKNPMTGKLEKLVKFTLKLDVVPNRQTKSLPIYNANSVLAGGIWYKTGITTTGVYKLDYNFLKNTCGFDLANTNFSTIAVFGNGGGMIPDLNATPRYDDLQENPTYIVDNNNNNKVDQGDYILFYAQGPDQWTYNAGATVPFQFSKNLYTDTNFYFITADQGTGKRIQRINSAASPNLTITQFDDYAVHEQDKYNLLSSGKMWFGDMMTSLNPSTMINFSFPNMITSSPVHCSSTIIGSSPYNSSFTVYLNGTQQILSHYTAGIPASDYPDAFEIQTSPASFSPPSSSFSLVYNFINPDGNGTSAGYIYNVILNAKRALTFTGGNMFFRSAASIGASNTSQFILSGANGTTHIWDVSSVTGIQEMGGTLSGSSLSFSLATPTLHEFAAVDYSTSFPTPIPVESVPHQNLHAIGQPNMLIVSPDDLMGAANDLAAYHAQHDGLTVKVASLAQIYNEFGSGRRDISAIRDFVRMVYNKAADSSFIPQYLLLFGDGSFDPKDRSADNNNQMPTYESWNSQNILSSYTTDDFFGCLDSTDGGDMNSQQQLDIAVGRLPAANATEAQGMVDKIKLYKSSASLASWRNNLTFVGDEPWQGAVDFEVEANGLGDMIRYNYPDYNVTKIICDAYQRIATPGGDRFPDVNTAILNSVNTGTLIISYTGHGGINNWANARIFNLSDIQNIQNHEKATTFVTATCDFSRFDDPNNKSAGEYLITNSQGGASAMISTVRPVYENANDDLQNTIFPLFFNQYHGRMPTVGEVVTETKNHVVSAISYDTQNTREFVLLGDPAMTLDYPVSNVVTTKIDNVPITQPHDTLKALKYVTISGEVRSANGARLTSFNGTCYPIVFDKLGSFNTLQNDPTYPLEIDSAYKSTLFKGQCSVINGAFSFSFIVPKDINYAVGYGRISYYADNGVTDANGYQNTIVIGGASDSNITSKTGPVIKLYMNDNKFVYGGITNANPSLYAELSDPYGINTTGNGLGHDLTSILDANTKNPIVLNNYYQSALNNFTKGTVTYPFNNLSEGAHTLQLKAWDILDNSNTETTEFIVASSAKLALQHVYNYPNPFTTNTQFMFEHNRPGEELLVSVQIFSVSGKLIKTIQENVVSNGYRVDNIRWDGLDDYGDKIGKGVYVYKVHVRDQEGNTANQFQKLVLLR